jgi:hypothetical protein
MMKGFHDGFVVPPVVTMACRRSIRISSRSSGSGSGSGSTLPHAVGSTRGRGLAGLSRCCCSRCCCCQFHCPGIQLLDQVSSNASDAGLIPWSRGGGGSGCRSRSDRRVRRQQHRTTGHLKEMIHVVSMRLLQQLGTFVVRMVMVVVDKTPLVWRHGGRSHPGPLPGRRRRSSSCWWWCQEGTDMTLGGHLGMAIQCCRRRRLLLLSPSLLLVVNEDQGQCRFQHGFVRTSQTRNRRRGGGGRLHKPRQDAATVRCPTTRSSSSRKRGDHGDERQSTSGMRCSEVKREMGHGSGATTNCRRIQDLPKTLYVCTC